MSFIRKTITAAICFLAVGSVSVNADSYDPTGDFTDYFDGAMTVYVSKISPSVETSKKFHDHIMKMYARSRCMNAQQCFVMGKHTANQFVRVHKMENREYEIQ